MDLPARTGCNVRAREGSAANCGSSDASGSSPNDSSVVYRYGTCARTAVLPLCNCCWRLRVRIKPAFRPHQRVPVRDGRNMRWAVRVLIVLDLRVHQRHAIHEEASPGNNAADWRGQTGTKGVALAPYLRGWGGSFRYCETPSVLGELDSWVSRRLRCVVREQCGNVRRRYAELKQRGMGTRTAAQAAVTGLGPWRFIRFVVFSVALPEAHFASLGLPTLTAARRLN